MEYVLAGIIILGIYKTKALIRYVFIVLLFIALYWIAPKNTPDFPWAAVFFFGIGAIGLVLYIWEKLNTPKVNKKKPLSAGEQAYQEWWNKKIDM